MIIARTTAQPEERDRPERRHPVLLACEVDDENERCERREGFDRIDVGAISSLASERNRARRRVDVVLRRKQADAPSQCPSAIARSTTSTRRGMRKPALRLSSTRKPFVDVSPN